MLPPPCFTVGTVLDRWWAVPGFLHTYRLELRPKSSILVSSDQRILQVFLANSMRAFMCLALRRGFRRATLHKAPTGGGLQWWLTFYNFLPSPECISGAQPQWSLGSSLPLSPGSSPPIAQFGRTPALGRVLVVPNVFHLRIMEATVLLGTLSAAEVFL